MSEIVIADILYPKVIDAQVEPDRPGEVLPQAGSVWLFEVAMASKARTEELVGKDSQESLPSDTSPKLDEAGKKRIQQIVGSFLYYVRAVGPTILMALSAIAFQQSAPTEQTHDRVNQFLDYMATHPDAKIRYQASDMVLNVHSDASYLSAPNARSHAGGYFFLGSIPRDDSPIIINGAIHITCTILKLVAASAAEAELGALFLNAQEAKVLQLVLKELPTTHSNSHQ